MSRHVLVINHYALPPSQGGGTRHVELFSRLDERNWSYRIIAANRASQSRRVYTTDHPAFDLVPVPAYDERNGARRVAGWVVFAIRCVYRGLKGQRPDVVYASTPHLLSALAGLVIARLRRARLVLEVRDLWPESLVEFGYVRRGSALHRFLTGLERRLYRAADKVVIVTPGWKQHVGSMGVPSHRISTVTNGSDPDFFAPRPGRTIRDIVGAEGPVAIYAGAHGPPNGLDAVLDAAARLPEVHFALVGDGGAKRSLVERARAEAITNVHFLDPVSKETLAGFLWTADIGIHSLADSDLFRLGMSPNKVFDYMAARLPVVSNAGGQVADIITESGCGLASAPDDMSSAVAAILERTADERAEMGARGLAWLESNASREAVARTLEALLLGAVNGGDV